MTQKHQELENGQNFFFFIKACVALIDISHMTYGEQQPTPINN